MPQKPNMLIAFLQELLQRFFTKSPKFFRIWQWISASAAAITGLPEALAYFNITLPPSLSVFQNKFITAVTLGMWVMSRLTTQSKIVGSDENGVKLKQTNADALPFTAAAEGGDTPPVNPDKPTP